MSLVEQIRAIEERFGETVVSSGAPEESETRSRLSTGWTVIDAALGGGLALAALHEWFGVAPSRCFTACREEEARGDPWIPPLLPIVHLAHQTLRLSSFSHHAVWIGRRCFPYGGAIVGAGNDGRLLERSLFVAADRPADRLWAVDLALRSPAAGLVVADGGGFDMAATRRIQLAAREHRKPALLVRPPWETGGLSAAQTRWLVRHEASPESVGGDRHSLNPRWSVELLRCKGMGADPGSRVWSLEWNRDEGAVHLSAAMAGHSGEAGSSKGRRRLRPA